MFIINKFCINCQHYAPVSKVCGREEAIRHINPVNGKTLYESAIVMRANKDLCGDLGHFYKQLESQPKVSHLERIKNVFKRVREQNRIRDAEEQAA
jgi:hypothetical protein